MFGPNVSFIRGYNCTSKSHASAAIPATHCFCAVTIVTAFRQPVRQRARAYTAPGSRTSNLPVHHTHQQAPASSDTGRANVRKRSYSAVLPRNISDEALRQLLSISRHTTPVPEKVERELPVPKVMSFNLHRRTQAAAMKGEVRKNSSKSQTVAAQSNDKLPAIPDPSAESEEATTKLSITVTKSRTQKQQNLGEAGQSEADRTLKEATKSRKQNSLGESGRNKPDRTLNEAHHSPRIGDVISPSGVTSSGGAVPTDVSLLSVVSIRGSKGVGQAAHRSPRSQHLPSGKGS